MRPRSDLMAGHVEEIGRVPPNVLVLLCRESHDVSATLLRALAQERDLLRHVLRFGAVAYPLIRFPEDRVVTSHPLGAPIRPAHLLSAHLLVVPPPNLAKLA